MDKFSSHTGIGVPINQTNIDTDQILPAMYLKRITKSGFEDALFAGWREDPEFILNREPYNHGSVLVAGADFGTGSSREHAVWALRDFGFKAVISPRFGDIFYNNAGKQGVVPAIVSESDVELIFKELENNPGATVSVNLEERSVECGGFVTSFTIDDYMRWRLMEGLDDIALTLRDEDKITAYEQTRPSFKPTTIPARVE